MSYNNTGIPIASQFNLRSPSPIDSRYVIETAEQFAALLSDNALYPGLSFALMQDSTVGGVTYKEGVYRLDIDGTLRQIDEIDVTAITQDEVNSLFESVDEEAD